MQLLKIENLRMLDRNKAGGNALLQSGTQIIKAEWVFYLQGNECLNIRLGRHDGAVSTDLLEKYLKENRTELRQLVKPDVIRLRKEQVRKNMARQNPDPD